MRQSSNAWLATVDDSGIPGNTVQHNIDVVLNAAMNYQEFVNKGQAQFFLTALTDSNYQRLTDQPILVARTLRGTGRRF
jgi:hypothetical protein